MYKLLHRLGAATALGLALLGAARSEILTRLPTEDKVVALTFDACEAGKVTQLDRGVADYLIANEIPFTVFVGGRFARDNPDDVKMLGALPFVELENHSWSHRSEMPKLSDQQIKDEVLLAELQIEQASGRRTRFFRFPAGNTDARTTALVESLGYKIVHWRWPSGDPDKHVTAAGMVRDMNSRVRPGDVLIFHINGNGVHTAEAIPMVVEDLKAKGYRFVLLQDYLGRDGPVAVSLMPALYP